MNLRQTIKFYKDFGIFEKFTNLDQNRIELIFSRFSSQKKSSFKEFIEILYQVIKFITKDDQKKKKKNILFKHFIEKNILPKYKEYQSKLMEYNIEKIQVFYVNYDFLDNPSILLLTESDLFFKNVKFLFLVTFFNFLFFKLFILYQTLDLKISSTYYMNFKNFYRFCLNFSIIPNVCSSHQIKRV